MTRPTATVHINTSYTTVRIGRQYARNLESAFRSEFPDWNVTVIPGSEDAVELPIENRLENFRTEFRIRTLMTDSLMKAINDCQNNRDLP
jgi:hypothetical protein